MRLALLPLIIVALWSPALALAQKNARQSKIDSLEKVIEATSEDTTKARSLCRLCDQLRVAGQIGAALENGEAGLELARAAGDRKAEAACLKDLGNTYWSQGEYARALDYYQQSLDVDEATGGRAENRAASLNNIGLIYKNQGDNARALDYYQKSLKLYAQEGDRAGQALSLSNIGVIYWNEGDDVRALDYFQQSLRVDEETGDRRGQAASLGNIGLIYEGQGEYARALDYFQQSLKIKEETGDRLGQAGSLHNIGLIYWSQGEYARAQDYNWKSLKIHEEIGDQNGVALALANIASQKIQTNQASEARRLAARALDIATEIGALDNMQFAAKEHSRADSALGDWKSAYEHYKLFKQYGDSLKNDEQSKEIGRLEAKYEFDIEIEARERQEAEEAEKREIIMWVAIGVFAALLLVAGLLTWGFQTKKKANKLLSAQNAEIIQQSEEISRQRDKLQTLNEQITEQRDVLEKAHEEITDSIDYASRIQHALLPSAEAMRQNADVFVYYNARDVVSGDFYWTHRVDADTALYSAADCTGHGVPGAFMSVLGATTLDTIVREYGETSPDLMLGLLDQSIRASLKQDENKDGALDGMDLALIKLDKKNKKLFFSSAGRPLFLLRKREILEYKGAKFPAGGAQHGEKEFPLVEIDLEPGDRVFMCSDGITDQFGGPRGRKFSPKRLKETLLAHQDKDLQTQGAAFAEVFDDWQKSAKQLDDQLLIGLAA